MARIIDPELSIDIDRAANAGSISVRCGLEFTDAELRAMNVFGRQYSLQCHLLGQNNLNEPDSAIVFASQQFPPSRDDAEPYVEPVFTSVAGTSDLKLYMSADGSIGAELALSNEDLGTVAVKRTPVVAIDLES